jgi:hypothetical protein
LIVGSALTRWLSILEARSKGGGHQLKTLTNQLIWLNTIPHQKLRIVLKPAMPVYEAGVKVGDQPGEYAQFEDGQFETKTKRLLKNLNRSAHSRLISGESPRNRPQPRTPR